MSRTCIRKCRRRVPRGIGTEHQTPRARSAQRARRPSRARQTISRRLNSSTANHSLKRLTDLLMPLSGISRGLDALDRDAEAPTADTRWVMPKSLQRRRRPLKTGRCGGVNISTCGAGIGLCPLYNFGCGHRFVECRCARRDGLPFASALRSVPAEGRPQLPGRWRLRDQTWRRNS